MTRKAWTWIVVGVVGAAAMAGGIVILVFSLTSGVVEGAESFLMMVGRGQYEEAYRAASPEFRANQDLNAFKATMQRVGLDKYDSASWSSRRIRNSAGTVVGSARTVDGKRIPLRVFLVRGEKGWIVTGMRIGDPADKD